MMLDGYTTETLMRKIEDYQTTDGIEWTKASDPPKMMGWICPVCGRGLSPFTSVCPCKDNGKGWEVTC